MKSRTFKISFKRQPHFGYQTCLVNADSASEARGELIRHYGGLYSIRSVSVQCAGETKSGNPCQRFSANDYCCDGHNPEAAKKAQRIKTLTDIRDLADDLIRLAEENHPDFQEAFSYYEAEIDEAGDNLTNVVGEAEHPYEV